MDELKDALLLPPGGEETRLSFSEYWQRNFAPFSVVERTVLQTDFPLASAKDLKAIAEATLMADKGRKALGYMLEHGVTPTDDLRVFQQLSPGATLAFLVQQIKQFPQGEVFELQLQQIERATAALSRANLGQIEKGRADLLTYAQIDSAISCLTDLVIQKKHPYAYALTNAIVTQAIREAGLDASLRYCPDYLAHQLREKFQIEDEIPLIGRIKPVASVLRRILADEAAKRVIYATAKAEKLEPVRPSNFLPILNRIIEKSAQEPNSHQAVVGLIDILVTKIKESPDLIGVRVLATSKDQLNQLHLSFRSPEEVREYLRVYTYEYTDSPNTQAIREAIPQEKYRDDPADYVFRRVSSFLNSRPGLMYIATHLHFPHQTEIQLSLEALAPMLNVTEVPYAEPIKNIRMAGFNPKFIERIQKRVKQNLAELR
jgi:hypothetical protein